MYVNTYLIPVPESRKQDYVDAARVFADVAKEFGALEIFENWELEVPEGEHTDFRKAVKANADEKIVVSWVVWPDRETGARAHREMYSDARMEQIGQMPFDGKRMVLGGFDPILVYQKT